MIFISIDDNEQANLKLLCDEVFGEMNFVGEFIWNKKLGRKMMQNPQKITNILFVLQYFILNLLPRT